MISPPDACCRQDTIILTHGLAAPSLVMVPLARSLRPSFGNVINWSYPSLWSRIETHGTKLAELLRQLDNKENSGRIHLVGHSMGAIISRLAVAEYLPERLGRVVMIAPPNRGSRVARYLAPNLGRLSPPVAQLADDTTSFVCSLPLPNAPEIGIIAAKSDFMVPLQNTGLGCETDHIVLPGLHSSVLWRRETAEQVRHFLETGRFCRQQRGSLR